MLYPSIDILLDKLDSKYTLVTVSSRRAREIQQNKRTFIDNPVSHKYVGMALEEINGNKISYKRL